MTTVDDTSKLRALWRARERLEAALAADERWQTLQNTAGARDAGAASLEAQLLSNPVYRAWKNVSAAIAARQPEAANAAGSASPAAQAPPTAPLPPPPARATAGADAATPGARNGAVGSEEASVSFVALTPARVRMDPPAAGSPEQAWRSFEGQHGPSPMPAEDMSPGEEAEVSVVSVDARRHAGAVDRLLRALRGEPSRG